MGNVNEKMVNSPAHYNNGSFEVIDEMMMVFGPEDTYKFCLMNAWKYRARAPYKGKWEEDMAKANRYLEYAKRIAETNNMDLPTFIHPTTGE